MKAHAIVTALAALLCNPGLASAAGNYPLWDLARAQAEIHRFSTLFTAQDVRQHLSSEEGIAKAIDWCKQTGVTAVFIESFRDGYQAEKSALTNAKVRFEAAGFRVSGCVTPTRVENLPLAGTSSLVTPTPRHNKK
jgi:hypothetical protein